MIWYPEQLAAARPNELTSLTEWAGKSIFLAGDSEIKGSYQLSMTPYVEPIFQFVDDPQIEEIVVRKSAQVGGTLMFLIIHLYRAIIKGKSTLLVYADEDTAKKVLKNKLGPIMQSSVSIRSEIARQENTLSRPLGQGG